MSRLTYSERAALAINPTAIHLLTLMDEKKSNLALSLDVVRGEELLYLADLLGPEIAVLKTHIDILEDFTPEVSHQLSILASKHRFLIFEDRKFADIGNTVKMQYGGGVYRISDWADITNAHVVVGPGIIEGLKEIGLVKGKGLLLLAEMSSDQNLATGKYTEKAIEFAKKHADFVIGFIARKRLVEDPSFIYMTPGIAAKEGQDSLGQRYLTPEYVIGECQSDLIIVGRAIYQASNPLETARHFRNRGFTTYYSSIK